MTATESALADYAMPSLGADMDEGTVIEWLVEVGDLLERGQIVARVETEKSDIDIEIWHDGVVAEIVTGAGATVPVGTTLMRFRSSGPASADTTPPAAVNLDTTPPAAVDPDTTPPFAADPDPASAPVQERADNMPPRGAGASIGATPRARRLAAERGITLDDVVGSGPSGAVRARDLPASRTRTDRMRSMIAARMELSNDDIPHYRLERDINLGPLTGHLAALNEARPITERVVPAAALVRAVAMAAARHPELNGTWADNQFHPGDGVNVSVAISLRTGGLVTPTIRNAESESLEGVMTLVRDFAMAARTGTMRSEWTRSDSSITVTNLGERGADLVHGLISPPEVALVGFGRIRDQPIVIDGVVVARPVVTATLGADHRATDGAVGSRFLSTVAKLLEEPECL